MSKKASADSGFSLLEVMVALAVLSIALVAVVRSQASGMDALQEARRRTEATWLAQMKMSELRAEGLGGSGTVNGTFEDDWSGYEWEVKVSVPPGLGWVNRVAVRVYWKQGERRHYVELAGYM